MTDEQQPKGFWGRNAKAFAIQAVVVVVVALTVGRFAGASVSKFMCDSLNICSKEQRQLLNEP